MKTIVTTLTLVCISLILVGISPLQGSAKIDPQNIVGLWLFDDGAGKVAKDSSGNGNDGKFLGDPKWVDGKFGKALEFNGKDDSIEAGSTGLLTGAKDRTIAFWVKSPNMAVGNKFLVGWGSGAGQQMSCLVMGLGNSPNQKFGFWGWGNDLPSNATLKNDTWYHIAFTLGGTSGKLYLDGTLDNQATINGLNTPPNTSFRIANFTTVMTAFAGSFDEVVISNVPLTEDDIKSLMQGLSRLITAISPSGKLTATWGRIKNYE
ncbi:LamG domain-containing protein [Candidatus Poribacteria bacterium]|nr:LamG domain-containing protein [Candidatus Poribacteria bacterium]